jgi:3-hydroxypropanoate dehydrogenase
MNMPEALDAHALDQLFAQARTHSSFSPRPVPDETLARLVALAQWGPTAFNCQPARFVFVRSAAAKARLQTCVSPGNVPKVASAPVTVIVATDLRFHERLPQQFPHQPQLGAALAADPARAQVTALRNGSLQGAYLILAARALGLDCGPMSGFDTDALDRAFFPEGAVRSNFLVNLGHGDHTSLRPRGPRLAFAECARLI